MRKDYIPNIGDNLALQTFYMYDATGTVVAIYEYECPSAGDVIWGGGGLGSTVHLGKGGGGMGKEFQERMQKVLRDEKWRYVLADGDGVIVEE